MEKIKFILTITLKPKNKQKKEQNKNNLYIYTYITVLGISTDYRTMKIDLHMLRTHLWVKSLGKGSQRAFR